MALRRFVKLLGPGLITGASDDDPSGIGTYSQVGSQFGFGLLWTALFTFPLMAAIQEVCARIALETGAGLTASLRRKFPTWLVGLAVLGLLVANTINVGADLGAVAAGGALLSRGALQTIWLVVPVAALILGVQAFGSYSAIFMILKWLTLALFAYVIAAVFANPLAGGRVGYVRAACRALEGLRHRAGSRLWDNHSPYLFFWQAASEVDELRAAGRLTEGRRRGVRTSDLRAARTDIVIGMLFSNLVMYFIILTTAAVLHAHGKTDIRTADQAAAALAPLAGPFAFIVFAVGIIGAGLLAIPMLSGSASYALKEFLGLSGSLASTPRQGAWFYAILAAATLAGVAMNFLRVDPIRALFVTAVINGVVAPPLLVLIVLLGSDRGIMRTRVSGRLSLVLTWLTTAVMALAALALLAFLVL